MPTKPKRPCLDPGCGVLTDRGRCERHRKIADQARGSRHDRGYTNAWVKASIGHLRHEPLCRTCKSEGRIVLATVTDHIVPHRMNMALFWDTSNWQSLCKPCHDRKTATEDGGFGRLERG